MMLPFSVALRVLPGAIKATLGGQAAEEGKGPTGGACGQIVRMFPLLKVAMMIMAYVKLLTVRNAQLEDDVLILRGLKVCAAYALACRGKKERTAWATSRFSRLV